MTERELYMLKDDNNRMFDVTMGSYDGAEACELVVCYLLTQLNKDISQKITLGLYRDDGLAAVKGTPSEIASIKQKICEIFKKNGLKITIETNKKIIDYLDVTLNLKQGHTNHTSSRGTHHYTSTPRATTHLLSSRQYQRV